MNILRLLEGGVFFSPEGDPPGGGASGNTGDDPGNKTDPKPGEGNSDPNGGGPKKIEWTPDQQKEIDRIMGEVRKTATETVTKTVKETLQAEADREKAEAQRKADEAKGEFESLYKSEKARADALQQEIDEKHKPVAARAEKYAGRINTLIEGEIKDWPKELRDLDPGSNNLDERMVWVEKSRGLAARLKNLDKAPNLQGGQGSSAKPSDAANAYMKATYEAPDLK
jgi:hypothetical protein